MSNVTRTGYHGFGSFHSDNVEDLIRVPTDQYQPPERPFAVDDLYSGIRGCELGLPMRRHFMIDFERWTFLNHGAFGAAAKPAQREAGLWRDHCESQPLAFLDRQLFPHLVRVIRELALHMNARAEDLVLLPNATIGLNTAISSVQLAPGDSIYMLDIGYGSVKKMLAEAARRSGACMVLGRVQLPVRSSDEIVATVAASLPERCRLAVFDVITSNTALRLPVEQLVQLCRSRGVPVLLDGAHALGQMPVDLAALEPDFFVANCHKWLCAPRGSGCLWVHPSQRDSVRPLVLSHGSGAGFTSDFIWDGNRDYSALLAVSAALRFWQEVGWERGTAYMRQLLQQAVELLASAWDSEALAPLCLCGTMACVALPAVLACGLADTGSAESADAKYIQDLLHNQHHIECPVKCLNGRLYVRISAAPYNVLQDYLVLADAVNSIAARMVSMNAAKEVAACNSRV